MAAETSPHGQSFLAGGGEMGARIRAQDWSATPLGPPDTWPQALRSALGICLNSSFPTAIYWGPELRLLYNDAWAVVPAQKHPEALGRPAREVWADIWAIIEPQFTQVITTGEGFSTYEQMLPMERGGRVEETYWNYSFTPIRDTHGAVVGVFNQGHEITANVFAQAALRASEERLQLALSASNSIGTWDWDVPNDRLTADARFAQLYGVDPGKAAAGVPVATFFERIHPDDLVDLRRGIGDALRTGEPFSMEYRVQQPDGAIRWVVAQGRSTHGLDGSPARFPGVSFDITERKETEEALRRLNERLEARVAERTVELSTTLNALQKTFDRMRTTFQTSFIYQGFMHTDGTLLDANAASLAGIEAKLEDVIGRPFWDTPWFTGTPGMRELVQQGVSTAARGESVRQTIAVRLPAGERAFEFSLRPVRNERGEVIAIVPEAVDITQLLQTEERLRQSQKMEAVGQLTGGIAHDFNNLLTGIIGSLDMMQSRIAQGRFDSVDRYVKAAITSANRAAALTHRLLAFSRRQPLDAKPIALNSLITDIEDMLRRTLGESIRLEIVTGGGVWLTRCDPNQLESSILNLVINARDAMPEGGQITIETSNAHLDEQQVSAFAGLKTGQYVCICVTDTGTGMSPDVMEKAFDPFFTTKPLGQGTGLGLSMIYGFVTQSEGHVTIDSTLGNGTTVKLYLPRHRGEIVTTEQDTGVTDTYRALSGDTVLVVEDELVVRQLILDVLSELGYCALEAEDGAAGLEILLSDERIDLLVTDVGLPELNGRQMVDQARARRPNLKVLFMTGYAENAMFGADRLEHGMQMITKPFAVEALAQRIREMIGRRA